MRKGKGLPRTVEFCHKRIIKLEDENETLSDALHKLANEAQVALMEKDRLRADMCKKCRRIA